MSDQPRFQYSLRTLFIVVTVTAIIMGILAPIARSLPQELEGAVWKTFGLFFVLVLCWLLIASWMERDRAADPFSPRRLASRSNVLEAQSLVQALDDEGIRATMVGDHTAGFRAEAPGEVQVVVAQQDLPRAKEILEKIEADAANAARLGQEHDEDSL